MSTLLATFQTSKTKIFALYNEQKRIHKLEKKNTIPILSEDFRG